MPFPIAFIYYCFVIWVMFSILTFPRMRIEKKLLLCFFTYSFPGLGPFIGYKFLKSHRDREVRRILREREAYRRRRSSRYAEPPLIIRQRRSAPPPPKEVVKVPVEPIQREPRRDPDNLDIEKDTSALDGLLEETPIDDSSPYVFRELKEKHDVLRELEHESLEVSAQSKILGTVALIAVVAAQVGVIWWFFLR